MNLNPQEMAEFMAAQYDDCEQRIATTKKPSVRQFLLEERHRLTNLYNFWASKAEGDLALMQQAGLEGYDNVNQETSYRITIPIKPTP